MLGLIMMVVGFVVAAVMAYIVTATESLPSWLIYFWGAVALVGLFVFAGSSPKN
jgi:hypothetical protein